MQSINNQVMNSFNNSTGEASTTPKISIENIAKQFIQTNVQNGKIEGMVKLENNQTLLELTNGKQISVKLASDVPTGKIMTFNASLSTEGEVLLKLDNASNSLINQVIQNLDLPDTDEMRACIESFMAKSLPLEKQDLVKANFNVKHFELPTEVVTNMVEKATSMTMSEREIAKDITHNGINTLSNDLVEITDKLSEDNKQEIREFIDNKNNLSYNKNVTVMTHDNATITNTDNTNEEISLANKELSSKENELLIKSEEDIITKSAKNIANNIDKNLITEDDITEVVNKFLLGDKIDTGNAKETIENILTNFKDLAKVIEEVSTKEDEEVTLSIKKDLEVVNQKLEVATKLQEEGNYHLLSPLMHQQLDKGSVHFFEPKNNMGKAKSGLYIVIALDLDALSHIQLHINKIDKNLSIQMYVENDHIKSYLGGHLSTLMNVIHQEGFQLNQILLETTHKENIPQINTELITSHNFDYRI